MHTVEGVCEKLAEGKKLLLAGDKSLLRQIPAGPWIAGTIPYFMTKTGGLCTKNLLHVTELPSFIKNIRTCTYNADSIPRVYNEAPAHGFSFIIIPAKSETHFVFALNAPNFENFATKPLIGWISGTHLDDWGKDKPKVFNGQTLDELDDAAIVMHIDLPENKVADIGIINMFEQGEGDTITFPESGFRAKYAYINGNKTNFSDYLQQQQLDKRLPLVADYYGTMINTAFQETLGPSGEVKFYNAVFDFLTYRHARPITNYLEHFNKTITAGLGVQSIFSCNCILNYLYSGLEGKRIECPHGPTTFGEIAYQTLNQTMVYLRIIDLFR